MVLPGNNEEKGVLLAAIELDNPQLWNNFVAKKRENNPEWKADLENIELGNSVKLKDYDLSGANFNGAKAGDLTFENCKLYAATFENAQIERDLKFVDCAKARSINFSNLQAGVLHLQNSDLSNADITDMVLYGHMVVDKSKMEYATSGTNEYYNEDYKEMKGIPQKLFISEVIITEPSSFKGMRLGEITDLGANGNLGSSFIEKYANDNNLNYQRIENEIEQKSKNKDKYDVASLKLSSGIGNTNFHYNETYQDGAGGLINVEEKANHTWTYYNINMPTFGDIGKRSGLELDADYFVAQSSPDVKLGVMGAQEDIDANTLRYSSVKGSLVKRFDVSENLLLRGGIGVQSYNLNMGTTVTTTTNGVSEREPTMLSYGGVSTNLELGAQLRTNQLLLTLDASIPIYTKSPGAFPFGENDDTLGARNQVKLTAVYPINDRIGVGLEATYTNSVQTKQGPDATSLNMDYTHDAKTVGMVLSTFLGKSQTVEERINERKEELQRQLEKQREKHAKRQNGENEPEIIR